MNIEIFSDNAARDVFLQRYLIRPLERNPDHTFEYKKPLGFEQAEVVTQEMGSDL